MISEYFCIDNVLTLRKIAIWMSKNAKKLYTFLEKKLPKIVFFQNNCHWNKMSRLWLFFTFKWRFAGGPCNMSFTIISGFPPGIPGNIRTRYPIMPVYSEGNTVWKELQALRTMMMDIQGNREFFEKDPGLGEFVR